MVATLVIEGAFARIEGKFPVDPVIDVTSFYAKGYEFSQRYRNGVWDGRIRLYRKANRSFPAGLTYLVKEALEEAGERVAIDDKRARPPSPPFTKDVALHGVKFDYPYDFQLDCMEKLILGQRGIASMCTNCLAGDTVVEVSMLGRSIKLELKELHRRFSKLIRAKWLDKDVATTKIRSKREEDNCIRLNKILDVTESGKRQLYKLTTVSGRTIRASKDHRFLTAKGWVRLENLSVGSSVFVEGKEGVVEQVALDKVVKIEKDAVEETYDVYVDKDHNFLADNIVVHNSGKCLGLHTLTLKYDGTIVSADQVTKGDLLMGPDSRPRQVLSTTRGQGEMYSIKSSDGREWVCNGDHILVLCNRETNEVVEISVEDYLALPEQRKYRQFSVGVDFVHNWKELPLDAYLLGIWFGMGDTSLENGVRIVEPHCTLLPNLKTLVGAYGSTLFQCEEKDLKNKTRYLQLASRGSYLYGLFRKAIKKGGRVPFEYLTASREDRARLLAGWADATGVVDGSNILFYIEKKSELSTLFYLSRSLGLQAVVQNGIVSKKYNKLIVSGDFSGVPIQLSWKRPRSASPHKPTHTQISVTPLGVGHYVGFTLDGDGRFLLGDFVVTHNTEIACLVTACLRLPTLFVVPGKELLYQTRSRFSKRLGLPLEDVGIIGDRKWQPGKWVTVATASSLYRSLDRDGPRSGMDFLKTSDIVYLDECHHGGSEMYYDVMKYCTAFYRFGLSGTALKRSDGADLKLIAMTGPVLCEIRNKDLIARGVSSPVEIQLLRITKPDIPNRTPWKDVYKEGIVRNLYRNRKLCVKAAEKAEQGLSVLILVMEIEHGYELDDRLWSFKQGSFVPHQFISGQERMEIRRSALEDFAKGASKILIASTILDEGVDIPAIDVLILAGGLKSSIKTLQRIGRGIRVGNKLGKLLVIDTLDFQHRYLLEHSLQRFEDYKAEDCFDIHEVS